MKTLATMAAVLALTGCNGTIHKTSQIGHVTALSIDARQRLVVSGTRRDGVKVVCAEPSPDAIVAQASYFSARADIPNRGGGQAAGGVAESAGSIGLRTQTIQLLRDGYYRVCEAYLNGAIGVREYQSVLNHIDTFMITLVAIEALGGVTVAPAIAIGAGGSLTVDGEKIDGDAEAKTAALQTINAVTANLSPEQSKAIAEIVLSYLEIRRDERRLLYQSS